MDCARLTGAFEMGDPFSISIHNGFNFSHSSSNSIANTSTSAASRPTSDEERKAWT